MCLCMHAPLLDQWQSEIMRKIAPIIRKTRTCESACVGLSIDFLFNIWLIRQIIHYGCSILMNFMVLVTVVQVAHVLVV
jgi:hypothetical protein